jgi:hypothetical protein
MVPDWRLRCWFCVRPPVGPNATPRGLDNTCGGPAAPQIAMAATNARGEPFELIPENIEQDCRWLTLTLGEALAFLL